MFLLDFFPKNLLYYMCFLICFVVEKSSKIKKTTRLGGHIRTICNTFVYLFLSLFLFFISNSFKVKKGLYALGIILPGGYQTRADILQRPRPRLKNVGHFLSLTEH